MIPQSATPEGVLSTAEINQIKRKSAIIYRIYRFRPPQAGRSKGTENRSSTNNI